MAMLRARGVWCMKIHGGPTMMAGAPDIVACVPVKWTDDPWADPIGIFVGFETKTPEGGNPSPIQEHQHGKIRSAYGQVFVPRSVEDAVAALESVGWTAPPVNP
jgi:hypothetical protein